MSAKWQPGGTSGWGVRSGIRPGGGDRVAGTGTMTVNVLDMVGAVHVPVDSTIGVYEFQIPAKTHTVSTAHASQTRVDIIYVRVWDTDKDSSGLREADTVYLAGTPGGGAPSAPGSPAIAFRVATITVTANSTNPSVVYDAPYLCALGGIIVCRSSAEYPSSGLYEGMYVDDQALNQLLRYSGSAWQEVARVPVVVTSGSSASSGWGTAAVSAVVTTGPLSAGTFSCVRTGANLVPGSDGNISPDNAMGTLPSSLWPAATRYVSCGNGDGMGECSVSTAGVISLRSWTPGNTISTGSPTMRVNLGYPLT